MKMATVQKALYLEKKKNQSFGRMLPSRSEFKLIYLSQLTKGRDFEFCYRDFKLF